MMKKIYLFILLCILLFPNVLFASDVLSQTYSSLTLQNQEVTQDEPFSLILTPKTKNNVAPNKPLAGGKIYLFALTKKGEISPHLSISEPAIAKTHYLRETEQKGVYIMSTNKLTTPLTMTATMKQFGNYVFVASYQPPTSKTSFTTLKQLKGGSIQGSNQSMRSLNVKEPVFDGFMKIDVTLLNTKQATKTIKEPFTESLKDYVLPLDEHGEKPTQVELSFYDNNDTALNEGHQVTFTLKNSGVKISPDKQTTDQKGSATFTLSGSAGEEDSVTFYIDGKRIAEPIKIAAQSLRPQRISFEYHKPTFTVDETSLPLDAPMIKKDGRAYLPLRAFNQALNAKTFFEPQAKVVSTYYQNNIITMTLESTQYSVGQTPKTMDAKPFAQNGITYVPIRFIATEFGYQVQATKTGVNLIADDKA